MTKKFRIWNGQKFLNEEEHSLYISQSGYLVHIDTVGEQSLVSDNNKVSWWTGLTDSQGVEIYEGDILEYKISGYKYRDLVFYEGCCFKSGPLDKSSSYPLEGISVIGLIIGNVFESPIN